MIRRQAEAQHTRRQVVGLRPAGPAQVGPPLALPPGHQCRVVVSTGEVPCRRAPWAGMIG